MISEDFHVHSSFSDGKNSPEEIVEAALARGMTRLGISDHSYTSFDLPPCVPKERLAERR
ncbi:MAG: PHP domain-containing protein, partial [Oscillospiraceae bacterium]|nr:PHP domain-containing protein [Oscillospiraceae bacterium]